MRRHRPQNRPGCGDSAAARTPVAAVLFLSFALCARGSVFTGSIYLAARALRKTTLREGNARMSLEISGVEKSFAGARALDDVSLSIERGAFFTILGPSGCGKTTLLRLIAGLETLDAGEIRLNGALVAGQGAHVPPEDRGVAVVFQSYALWPHMNVRDNVAFPRRTGGASPQEAEAAAADAMAAVHLQEFAARMPAALSGGQRQRVALARCLAQNADIVLMDEPLANLDPHLRGAMEAEFAAFRERSGATIVYITHDQREAMALSDQAAVMDRGRVLQVGAPEQLYRRPKSERVAAFIGRSARVDAQILGLNGAEARVRIGPFEIDASHAGDAVPGKARAMIRPEDIAIGPAEHAKPARIVQAFYRGGAWEVALRLEGVSEDLIAVLRERPQVGETAPVAILGGWILPKDASHSKE